MNTSIFAIVLLLVVLQVSARQMHVTVDKSFTPYRWSISSHEPTTETDTFLYCASVDYEDSFLTTGWDQFSVVAPPKKNSKCSAAFAAYAAGYAEGYLMAHRISDYNTNMITFIRKHFMGDEFGQNIVDFLHQNKVYVEETAKAQHEASPLNLLLAQFKGIHKGQNDASLLDQMLTEDDLWLLNSAADLIDISASTVPHLRPDWNSLTPEEAELVFAWRNHCSALVRIPEDLSEAFLGHATWMGYVTMIRALKSIDFSNAVDAEVPMVPYKFSSYPGLVWSADDFMVSGKGDLAIFETSNELFDHSRLGQIVPKSLLTWHRANLAIKQATTGEEFCNHLGGEHVSGTYNNSYVVLSYKVLAELSEQYDNLSSIPKGTTGLLSTCEQVPNKVYFKDLTDYIVENGYYPSFNIPFQEEVFNILGYDKMAETDETWAWETAPRRKVFAEFAPNVEDIEGFKTLMRYNDYKNDALSLNNPGNMIAARYDLRDTNAMPFGALDAKITSRDSMSKDGSFIAISSPTYDQQKPWSLVDADWPEDLRFPHKGLIENTEWKFNWIEFPQEE